MNQTDAEKLRKVLDEYIAKWNSDLLYRERIMLGVNRNLETVTIKLLRDQLQK